MKRQIPGAPGILAYIDEPTTSTFAGIDRSTSSWLSGQLEVDKLPIEEALKRGLDILKKCGEHPIIEYVSAEEYEARTKVKK